MVSKSLPTVPDDRIAVLAARLRWLRVVRGLSAFAVIVVLATAWLVLLDAAFTFSVVPRIALQLLSLGVVVLSAWRCIAVPYRTEITREQIARRLVISATTSPRITSVQHSVEALHKQALSRVAPARPVMRFALASALLLLTTVSMIAVMPGAGERIRRAWLPWYRMGPGLPYRVVVTSGDPVISRGAAVTLSAYVETLGHGSPVPDQATLVVRTATGETRRHAMAGDLLTSFHFTLPAVDSDLEYWVEVGAATSPTHSLLVADPVELDLGTMIDVIPPPYAAHIVSRRKEQGFRELSGLQYSTAHLTFHLNRPPATAFLEWHPDEAPAQPGVVIPLTFGPDRLSATATLQLIQSGTLRIHLTNEQGPRRLKTEQAIPVRVIADAPPRLVQMNGLSVRPRLVKPDERILVSFTAVDDVALASAELEYAFGPTFAPQREPIALTGRDRRRCDGRALFALANRMGEGQTVRLRLRITDGRQLASPALSPQSARFPAEGWAEFTVSSSAPSLEQQDYIDQRDALTSALMIAIDDLREVERELDRLHADSASVTPLPLDHRVRLDRIRDATSQVANRIQSAARESSLIPDLLPLATSLDEVARGPLTAASATLVRARTDNSAERRMALAEAGSLLQEARNRFWIIQTNNIRFAQWRLDRHRLGLLAFDQAALADRAAAGVSRDELRHRQLDLLAQLRTTIGASDPLLRGFNAATNRRYRELAGETQSVAALGRAFDLQTRTGSLRVRETLLADVAAEHSACARSAERLQTRTATAARLTGIAPIRAADYVRVVELLNRDDLLEARVELETLAADAEQVAGSFDSLAQQRGDAKLAARQLAAWQLDLRARVLDRIQAAPFAMWPEVLKAELRVEQRALFDALHRLRFPNESTPTLVVARGACRRVTVSLSGEGRDAVDAMKLAADALNSLAEQTPTVPARLAATRPELDRIFIEQESLHFNLDQIIRPFLNRGLEPGSFVGMAKKLEGFAQRQEGLAGRLAALDLPGCEWRQVRLGSVLREAVADLHHTTPYDILASQAAIRRELERLKLVLDAQAAPDDRVAQLAVQQAELAQRMSRLGPEPSPRELETLVRDQRAIQKGLDPLTIPEAASLLHEAREAVRIAEPRDGVPREELTRRMTAAAGALQRLANAVAGAESPFDRIQRLSTNRFDAADEARKLAGQRFNPDASSEARRQLARELEELTATRVGSVNQLLKRDLIKAYVELQKQTEPDRQFQAQKSLAELLGTLAARMADIDELAFGRPAAAPQGEYPEDRYLPSHRLADELRVLATQVRAVRLRVGQINDEHLRILKPTALRWADSELTVADVVLALAQRLDAAARDAPPADLSARNFAEAAAQLRRAVELLKAAAENNRAGSIPEAERLRQEAVQVLAAAAARTRMILDTAPLPTDPHVTTLGDALRDAELAMRHSAEHHDPVAAAALARQAWAALLRANESLDRVQP